MMTIATIIINIINRRSITCLVILFYITVQRKLKTPNLCFFESFLY